jgi:uncharacterized DUF497 family protein
MANDWGPKKAAQNLAKHGIAFERIEDFDWHSALIRADTRQDYGEVRLVALGLIGARLHHVTFTIRRKVTWIISLRKASDKEMDRYEDET